MVPASPNSCGRCDNCGSSLELSHTACEGVIAVLKCFPCNQVCYKCTICGGWGRSRSFQSMHLTTQLHLAYLRDNNNSSNESLSVVNHEELEDNTPLPTSTKEYLDALKNSSDPPSTIMINDSFPHHTKYYEASLASKAGNYLLHHGITRTHVNYQKSPGDVIVQKCSDANTLFALLLSYLSNKLSKNDRSMLLALLSFVKANNDQTTNEKELSLFIPTDDAELRRVLIDGTCSVYGNLPVPPIIALEDNDVVYVPLKNTITQQFAKKSRIPNVFLPFSESIHGSSPRGTELLNGVSSDMSSAYREKVYPLKLILWTDAFQCFNVSINSEASAHTCTATVGAMDGDHSGAYSFPVWLGKKSGNRAEVERLLVQEINELATNTFPVYHSGVNRIVNVKIHLYTFLCDRPDKSGLLGTLSSKYCARFGYAGDLTKVINSVVCCDECFRLLCVNAFNTIRCCVCVRFDFKRIKYKPADNYPPDKIPPNGLLPMKRLKFSDMAKAVVVCFEKIRDTDWTAEQAKLFMRSEGIAGKLTNRSIKNGQCAAAFKKAEECLSARETLQYIADKKNHPDDYEPPPTPALWQVSNDIDIGVFIDAYMHLLFLGVMKAISTDMLMRFLVPKKKVASFIRTLNKKINNVHKTKAPYMPIHKSCGESKITFGGCLSRQWITICRLSKWLFCHVGCVSVKSSNVDMDFTCILPTHRDFFRYNIPEIKFFCHKYGIPIPAELPNSPRLNCWFGTKMESPKSSFSHFDDDDILNYITEHQPEALAFAALPCAPQTRYDAFITFITKHHLFPPIVTFPPEHVEAGDYLMTNVVVMYQCFVARVMGSSDHESIDRHCKAFLTNVHKLDTILKRPNAVPMLLTRFNLLTLLNAAESVRRFGSARSLWEGGMMGEGGIPRLKQRIHNLKKGFAKTAIHSFFPKKL